VPRKYSESMRWLALLLLAATLAAGCVQTAHRYEIRGQVLQVGPERPDGTAQVTVRHEDIPGFMPAMTMAYVVKPKRLLDGVAPGDLFTGTLVVDGNSAYLSRISKTGHAPVPAGQKPVRILDVLNAGETVPDDALVDQTGATHRLSDWRGRAVAVTFVYTRCPVPDFCPLMDHRFQELQRAILADAALRERVHLVTVSFDPQHDTPDVIRRHAADRGADPQTWSYTTGTPAAIDHLTSRFGVSLIDEDDGGATIGHNLRTAVVDRKGRLVKIYSGNDWSAETLLADLRDASGR
jgi:protein SCO1